jgi:ElaB/YqjD/DUF883 family membrane-anchored ribosome-binding protein
MNQEQFQPQPRVQAQNKEEAVMSKNQESVATATSSMDQLMGQASRVKEDVQELGHIARDVAREKYQELRTQAGGYVKAGTDKARQWETSFENEIREHPLRSIAIAAGVGLVVGYLIRRR